MIERGEVIVGEYIEKEINNLFVAEYFRKTGIDLNKDDKLRDTIFDIHTFLQDTNNYIQELMINYNEKKMKLYKEVGMFYFSDNDFTEVKDIYYQNLFNKLRDIYEKLNADNLKLSYDLIQDIINSIENKKWYERID